MRCPGCGYGESKVIDSRPVTESNSIRRRRECLACQKRFNTYEMIETLQIVVVKKSGGKELFDKQKLLSGVLKATEKRPVDAVALVKAPTQAAFADKLKPHLTEEEADYFRRGKNAHTHAAPKAASRAEYAKATGLETLFGALYLLGRTDRLNELFHIIMCED